MQVPICGPPNARTKPDLFTPGSIAHSPGSNSRDATFRAAAWVGPSIIRLNLWPQLGVYLDNGRIEIDQNNVGKRDQAHRPR